MVRKCCICQMIYIRHGPSFHKYRSSENKILWKLAAGLDIGFKPDGTEKVDLSGDYFFCSTHFRDEHIYQDQNGRSHIRRDVYPDINVNRKFLTFIFI